MAMDKVERKSFFAPNPKRVALKLNPDFIFNFRLITTYNIKLIDPALHPILFGINARENISGEYQILASRVIEDCPAKILLGGGSSSEMPLQTVFHILEKNVSRETVFSMLFRPSLFLAGGFASHRDKEQGMHILKQLRFWWDDVAEGWALALFSFDAILKKGYCCLEPVPPEESC